MVGYLLDIGLQFGRGNKFYHWVTVVGQTDVD